MAYIYASVGCFAVRIPVSSLGDMETADAATCYSIAPDQLPDGAWVPLWELGETVGGRLEDRLFMELSIAVKQYQRERKEWLS